MTRKSLVKSVTVSGFAGDILDVQLPSMSFDGVVLDFPPVTFHRISGIVVEPINC